MILKIPMPAELLYSMPSSGSTSSECLVLTMKRGGLRTPGRLSSWLILQHSTRILPGRPRASEPSTPVSDRDGSAMNWHTTFHQHEPGCIYTGPIRLEYPCESFCPAFILGT